MEGGKDSVPDPAGDPGQIRGNAGRYLTAASLPHHRAIVALDIEQSTRRPDPVKAEFRSTMYELFETALRSAGIQRCHRDRFVDRGDGVLALIRPVRRAPKAILLNQAIPALSRLLADYNDALPSARPGPAAAAGPGRRACGRGQLRRQRMLRRSPRRRLPPARRRPGQTGAASRGRPADPRRLRGHLPVCRASYRAAAGHLRWVSAAP